MDYADNGDLFQKIRKHAKLQIHMKEEEIWRILICILAALRSLHSLKIMHRDLKSANVFLYRDQKAKLGDLNVSKVAKQGLGYTQTGTPYYASPEVWMDKPYSNKSDIWSLGCVIYEATSLKPPFRSDSMEGLFKKVLNGYYPNIPSHYSKDLSNVIRSMLNVNPKKRPNCDDLASSSIISSKIDDLFNCDMDPYENELLETIKCPKNIESLSKNRLPQPTYESPKKVKVRIAEKINLKP